MILPLALFVFVCFNNGEAQSYSAANAGGASASSVAGGASASSVAGSNAAQSIAGFGLNLAQSITNSVNQQIAAVRNTIQQNIAAAEKAAQDAIAAAGTNPGNVIQQSSSVSTSSNGNTYSMIAVNGHGMVVKNGNVYRF